MCTEDQGAGDTRATDSLSNSDNTKDAGADESRTPCVAEGAASGTC